MENPNHAQPAADAPSEIDPIRLPPAPSRRRLWLWRLFLVAVWFVVYSILQEPLDTWLVILTVLALGIWLYNRVCGRMKLPSLKVKFERVERITLTHILLALLLLVMFANHSELVKINTNTAEVRDGLTDVENGASDNAEDIKSSLDDVKNAIEETQ